MSLLADGGRYWDDFQWTVTISITEYCEQQLAWTVLDYTLWGVD